MVSWPSFCEGRESIKHLISFYFHPKLLCSDMLKLDKGSNLYDLVQF